MNGSFRSYLPVNGTAFHELGIGPERVLYGIRFTYPMVTRGPLDVYPSGAEVFVLGWEHDDPADPFMSKLLPVLGPEIKTVNMAVCGDVLKRYPALVEGGNGCTITVDFPDSVHEEAMFLRSSRSTLC